MHQARRFADRMTALQQRTADAMSLPQRRESSRATSIRLPRRHRCSQTRRAGVGTVPRAVNLRYSERAVPEPIETSVPRHGFLMAKVANASEYHRHVALVSCCDHFFVTN